MKRNIIRCFILSLFAATLFSCSNTEDNLFEDPASLRLEKNKEKYRQVLENAEEGWILPYFPNPEQKYGGINLYLKFKDGNVTAQVDGIDLETTSMYSLLNRGGNVLSFNLYNPILHNFAQPSGAEPKGKEGDFEFLILSQEGDKINLQGLRTGNLMTLTKLKESSKDYKAKTKEVVEFLSGVEMGSKIGESIVEIGVNNSNLIFKYEEEGKEKVEKVAFVMTDKGINLYKPITISGVTAQHFILDKEKKILSNNDGKFIIKLIYPPIDFSQAKWILNTGEQTARSSKVKETFDLIANEDKQEYGETLNNEIWFGLCFKRLAEVGISFNSTDPKGKTYRVHYDLGYKGVLQGEDYIDVLPIGPGINWKWYPFLYKFVDFIAGGAPYKVTIDDKNNPTEVRMVSTVDSDIWFVLKKAKK